MYQIKCNKEKGITTDAISTCPLQGDNYYRRKHGYLCLFSSFSRIDYKNNLLMSFTSQRTGIEIVKMTT